VASICRIVTETNTPTTDRAFSAIFPLIVATEGGLSTTPADPGNWTGGQPNVGQLKGTKYGISAAAYPNEDIQGLTLDRAKALYFTDYWLKARCSDLPAPLALIVFDAAVNNGPHRAVEWLQTALRVTIDGIVGPNTLSAVTKAFSRPGGGARLCSEFMAHRIDFMAQLETWSTFGLGWSRRLAHLPFQAALFAAFPP